MDSIDKNLLKDLDRLAKRVNSEEGIPMFLACENLVPVADIEGSENIEVQKLNNEFVSMFRRDVEFVQTSRPDAPLTDIAKIVERLAEQNFALVRAEENR